MEALRNASFTAKEIKEVPKGAKILSKTTNINVEEIENGFLVSKTTDVKYEINKMTDYLYQCKKYFSKENPLSIDLENFNEKSLADNFK